METILEDLASPGALIAHALEAWRPPPRRELDEWADAEYYLSPDAGAADPGPWRTLAFQRGWMKAFTDPAVETVSIMKSARVGFTSTLLALIGYHIDHDPCPMLLIQPTLHDAKGFSKESVTPMLRDCAAVAEKIAAIPPRRQSLLYIRFPGGVLQLAGARSPSSFRRVGRRMVGGDEIDAYPPSAGPEGDPIALATRRSEYFWNRKLVWGSTPLLAGASRIEQLFLEGDQRRFYVPCPQCGHMDYLAFRREAADEGPASAGHLMRWTKGQPETAHFVCSDCGGVIEQQHKRAMIEAGEWRAHAPFTGHASFHVWSAYSYSPQSFQWAQVAAQYEQAAATRETLKVFVNTGLGETWKDDGDAPDWQVLYQRRDPYAIGTCPRGVLFLTAGVDVQKDRLVYEVVGWGRGRRSWSIDAHTIPGDSSDETATGPWPQLDALLNRTFRHVDGAELRILLLAIDSGFNTQVVYRWARRYPLNRVIATKGHDRGGALVGAPSKVEVALDGRKGRYKVWPMCGAMAKTELYGWLHLLPPTDEARATGVIDPPGFCRWPQYGEDYFKQLTAEHLEARKSPEGYTVYVWTLPLNAQNHYLDARVNARAAAAVLGIDRFSDRDWQKLDEAIARNTPPPNTPSSEGSPPVPPRPPRRRRRMAPSPYLS